MSVRNVLNRTVPLPVILALVIVLPLVGFLVVRYIGGGGTTTISVNATVIPERVVGGLSPGGTGMVTVLVRNPNDDGARVRSISAGSSEGNEGCPAGLITSEPVENPAGYIAPKGVNAYPITLTMGANADDRCQSQTFTLPLTVELSSAAAER